MTSGRPSHRPVARGAVTLITALGLVGLLASCESPYPTAARAEHVVLIGFDGFDPSYLDRVETPNLDALAQRGSAGEAISVMMPYTMPAFTAITTGAWPNNSGAITDYWDRETERFVHHAPATELPTIAEHVRADGGTTAAVRYPSLNGHGVRAGDPEALYASGGPDCTTRFDTAIDILHQRPVASGSARVTVPRVPTFLAVYCSELDDIGHARGAEDPGIDAALADLDAQVGRLVAALDELGIADETTVILSGDHGMSSYTGFVGLPLHLALSAAGYSMSYLWLEGQEPAPGTDVIVVPFGGRGVSVHLVGDRAGDQAALAEVRDILEAMDEIGAVYDRADQEAMLMHPDFGDLVAEPAPGWGDDVPLDGPLGGHGTVDELVTVFVAAGAGIADTDGATTLALVNIGPTIAYLLGLDPLPGADAGPTFGIIDRSPVD